jgi:hypothetical protein
VILEKPNYLAHIVSPQLSESAQLGAISIQPLAVSLVLFNPKFIKLT